MGIDAYRGATQLNVIEPENYLSVKIKGNVTHLHKHVTYIHVHKHVSVT